MIANNTDGAVHIQHHADKGLQEFMHSQQSIEEENNGNNINDITVTINAEDGSSHVPTATVRNRQLPIVTIGTSQLSAVIHDAEL